MVTVVGISGPIGSGKTSVACGLAALLGNSELVHFDDYQTLTHGPLADFVGWTERGADFNELVITGLAEHLEHLLRSAPIDAPNPEAESSNPDFIIFETPFGRAHEATGRFIGTQVWIDAPLDVALSRKMKEYVHGFLNEHPASRHSDCLKWMESYLAQYEAGIHGLMQLQEERLKDCADIHVDGTQPLQAIVNDLAGRLEICSDDASDESKS